MKEKVEVPVGTQSPASLSSNRRVRPSGKHPPLSDFFRSLAGFLLAVAVGISSAGCFGFLKPAPSTARHFVLMPLTATNGMAAMPGSLGIGVGRVRVPPYLLDTSLAVRKGTNEIEYLPSVLWAERLEYGLQRVLAANLSALLLTDQVRLSAWRSEDVSAEVYVAIHQFDVDVDGQGVLVAWWRILSPGGEKTLKAGETRLARRGPSPNANPAAAIATLSDLLAEFSRQLAQSIKEATAMPNPKSEIRNPKEESKAR